MLYILPLPRVNLQASEHIPNKYKELPGREVEGFAKSSKSFAWEKAAAHEGQREVDAPKLKPKLINCFYKELVVNILGSGFYGLCHNECSFVISGKQP